MITALSRDSDNVHDGRTLDYVILQQQGDGDEEEVEHEHDHGHAYVQTPVEGGDGQYDEQQHHEQQNDRADHARRVDRHRPVDQCEDEPREGQSEWKQRV